MEKQPSTIPVTEGAKRILNTVQKELFPAIKNLKDLLIKVHKCRPFLLYSRELIELEKEYDKAAVEFFTVTTKLETPDILFEGLKDEGESMVAYFQYRNAFLQNIEQGSRYVEIIDRSIDRKNQNIQNFRTFIVAVIAILVGIIWH